MAIEAAKPDGMESKVVKKFIKTLAEQLAADSTSSNLSHLLPGAEELKQVLQKSTEDLPSGKLRTTLLRIQQDSEQHNTFISSLLQEIESVSAKVRYDATRHYLFTTLSNWLKENAAFHISSLNSEQNLTSEDKQIIICQDPPVQIIWTIAAMELLSSPTRGTAFSVPNSARTLLRGLKPLVVGHRSQSTAVATLAPLAFCVFESLQHSASKHLDNIRDLRAIVKEALSFISAVNNKPKLQCGIQEDMNACETSFCSDLISSYYSLLYALDLQGPNKIKMDTDKLKLLFPLVSTTLSEKLLKEDCKLSTLSAIVRIEFVLLQMILEVNHWKEKKKLRGKQTKTPSEEHIGAFAVSGVAAVDKDKELILDLLLSDIPVSDFLDDKEKDIVYSALYKALLVGGQHNTQTNQCSTIIDTIKTFLKRITVARNIACRNRLKGSIDDLASKLSVPPELISWLRSVEAIKKPPANVASSSRALIGWLLHLEDKDFQGIIDSLCNQGPQVDNKCVEEGDDKTEGSDYQKDPFSQLEGESLFFLDTGGEGVNTDSEGETVVSSKKNSKKRKERKVLFKREAKLIPSSEGEKLSNISLDDTSGGSDVEELKCKRRHEGTDTSDFEYEKGHKGDDNSDSDDMSARSDVEERKCKRRHKASDRSDFEDEKGHKGDGNSDSEE